VMSEAKVMEKTVQEQPCPCFKAGEIQLDVFGAWAASADSSAILENNGWGGGIGVNYFMTKYFGAGIEGDYLAADGGLWIATGSLIARLPIEGKICWAPYAFVGGGGLWDGSSAGLGHAGAGVDVRVTPRIGVILDSRYCTNFGEESFVLTRAGLRFSF
jgi:hypothetical protein